VSIETGLLKATLATIMLIVVSSSQDIINEAGPEQRVAGQFGSVDVAPVVCVVSGDVVNSDTGEPVPYFHLLHMKSNGGLIEHLETDEQGRFHTTAPRGSQRYFRFGRSRRGTYIIDWDRQRQTGSRPFRGIIRDDTTDLHFQVKLWPVDVLTGKVIDTSGQTANNAAIYIHCDVPAVRTDPAGLFKLQVAPTDRDFDLFVISEDMNQAVLVHLKAGTTASTIHLEPTASYKGHVIDTKGRTVGPFKLILGMRLNGSDSDCLQEQIQTDTNGTFNLDYLCPKARYRAWWHPDEQINRTIGEHGEKIIDLRKYKPIEPIEIVVEQYLNTLSGRMLDGQRKPVRRAKIMVLTRHGIQAQHRRHKAVYSDEDGAFRLLNLTDGEVLFNIYAKGYKSREVWAPTNAYNLEITLKSPSESSMCEVWVVDDEGQPIVGAPVNLYFSLLNSGKFLDSHAAKTDTEGKAEFKITPFGDNVQASGTVCCDFEAYDLAYNSVSDKEDSNVKLVLHKADEHWAGKIIDPDQNPIIGAKLYMTSMSQRTKTPQRTTIQWLNQSHYSDQSELTLLAETNAKGEFVLHRFSKKDFVRVIVKAAGFKRKEIDFSPELDTGTIFQLSSRAAIVKGLLVYESSGGPVSAAEIKLRAYSAQDRDIITDVNGSFVVDDLEAGEYVPVLGALEDDTDIFFVCVPEMFVAKAGEITDVTLKVQKGILVQGRLIESSTGKRPTARRIYLEVRLKSGLRVASCKVEEDASWQLLVPAGQYDLYYSILIEEVGRFRDNERPLPITVESGKAYNDLILEMDSRGQLSMCPSSLVDKVLPDLKTLGINHLSADLTGKRILVCFWDINQRPSRRCMTQLAKQAEQFRNKGLTVIAVHASKIDQEVLNQWIKKYNIPFPVGMVQSDTEKTRFAWGVKSLPWLILTDSKHIIRAEGFVLTELDDKITATR
jgi:peroxiredoxin